jgi:hypothetical protein
VTATDVADSDTTRGAGVVRASWAGTAVFAIAAVVGATNPDPYERLVAVVSGVLFALGVGAFLWAFGLAVARSRTDEISVAGLWFLSGSAPSSRRRPLMLSLAVQVVVAIAAASVRPYTEVAFGVLVPVYGLGLAGLWGARYGTFPRRRD